MIVAGTGHRPHKLGGYDESNRVRLVAFAHRMLDKHVPDGVIITGMAQGWDTALAVAAHRRGLPFWAYVPCDGFETRWPADAQRRYKLLLEAAARVEVVCPGPYAVWKPQKRNERMVDDSEQLLALWDGSTGGTFNCLQYANSVKHPVINLWQDWEAYCNG